jgi:hypothetical protein
VTEVKIWKATTPHPWFEISDDLPQFEEYA